MINPQAERFERISYIEALNLHVGVLDSTALSLCMDNQMPIIVLNLWVPDNLEKVVMGYPVGTLISN